MNVVIVDYGMGNIGSVSRALEECGASVAVSAEPEILLAADHVILPGVGAFPDGMEHLRVNNTDQVLREIANKGTPVLGICLGMQLLADSSEEVRKTDGLGLVSGDVVKISSPDGALRIPHVGWNEVNIVTGCPLFEDIPDASDFYFVHSYHFRTRQREYVVAETPYGDDLTSVVARENVFGVQFHPEKSAGFGLRMLKNFISL
jgi:glutamine amidotransferase